MIDSHTHLFLCEGTEAELVAAAAEAGVGRMLNVGLGEETNPGAIACAERNEGVFAAVGRHPNDAAGFDDAAAAEIARLGAHEQVRAIGETGLDFYRDTSPPEEQRRAFAAQIEIASELDLPLVIHARDADGETAAIDEIFDTLDRRAAGADGDPALLLGAAAGPRRDRARLVLLVRRQRHLPALGGAARGRGAGPRGPDPGRDRRSVPDPPGDAPRAQPAGQRRSPRREVVAEVRGVSYEELERAVEANARALFGW